MGYPRLCAHRGYNAVAPENSIPAFDLAIECGASEIEFDIWATKDGVLVSSHDPTLERVSDGEGKIYEHTYEELLGYDFGIKHGEKFRGLRIATFEELLQRYARRVIMNIHVKLWYESYHGECGEMIEEIVSLVRKYKAEEYVYFMAGGDEIISRVMRYAPDIRVCVGWAGDKDPMSSVNRAIALGAKKIQLFRPYFNEETVKCAHEHGILCNVFYADKPEDARAYFDMGIDTVLTNDYMGIYSLLKDEYPINTRL